MLPLIYNIIYHILLVLTPIAIYQNFFMENQHARRQPISKFLLILLIVLILTMSNPVPYANEFQYDFRFIPILLAFLYGGIYPGVLTVITMLSYSLFLGIDTFYITVINYIIASIFFILILRKFNAMRMKIKLMYIGLFYLGVVGNRCVVLIMSGEIDKLLFMFTFSVLTFLTIAIVVFMIENINNQFAMKEELAKTERLNMISHLAASIAHEIRNPMTSIKGFMQLMKEDSNLNPSQQNYIRIVLNELDRTEAIIHEYLSLARPVSLQSAFIDLAEEIKSTIDLMTSFANNHNIEIQSDIDEGLYTKGRKGEIKQVMLNMIKNGVEAIGSNGTLTVKAYSQKSHHVIEVIDTGIGMTADQIKRLGTPFYSTKDKGTGVGLTVSFNIIRNMKGYIRVESEKKTGTKFIIHIPAAKESQNKI